MRERVLGGLLGHAIGDAIGFPYEGVSREVLRRRPVEGMPAVVRVSDDTALMLCTARNLCEVGVDPEDLARRFVGWLERGECTPDGAAIGVGRTTYEAIKRIASGTPPLLAGGRGERDNGNGSLMRMLPLVFYLYGRPSEELLEVIGAYSSVTHAHRRSVIACHIYVLFGINLCSGLNLEEALGRTVEEVRRVWEGDGELGHYSRILDGSIVKVPEEEVVSNGYVIHTLEATLWTLFRTSSFREAVLRAVNLGGDTDTVAALVGGLAGILYGIGGIPEEWVRAVPLREELESLALCLFGFCRGEGVSGTES